MAEYPTKKTAVQAISPGTRPEETETAIGSPKTSPRIGFFGIDLLDKDRR